MAGNPHLSRPGQDQRRRLRRRGELLKIVQKRVAALVPVDAPQIQDEALREPMGSQHRVGIRRHRRFETGTDDRVWSKLDAGTQGNEPLLLRREEDVAGREAKEVAQHVQVDGPILLGGGHQHGAVRHQGNAEVRRIVAVGPEEHGVV